MKFFPYFRNNFCWQTFSVSFSRDMPYVSHKPPVFKIPVSEDTKNNVFVKISRMNDNEIKLKYLQCHNVLSLIKL